MSQVNPDRRRFLGSAVLGVAGARILLGNFTSPAVAESLPPIKLGANASFGALKQVDAGVLNVGYAEAGPADGAVVILLHGWPYDIHSFVDVAPALAQAGYRVIVPHLRGYGTTRFLSDRDDAQRPARGAGRRHRGVDGCARHQAGDRLPALIGVRGPPTSSRRSGRSASRRWSR